MAKKDLKKNIKASSLNQSWLYKKKDLPRSVDGKPGKAPFLRGPYPSMYRGKLWTMRQYSGFGSAKETNKRFHNLIKHGQTGLSVAFDLPTQLGYDADHKLSRGEVGKVGVSITSLKDMEELFHKLPLKQLSTSMTINSTAMILLAMYVAVAKKQKVPMKNIAGTLQNDIFKEYFARGTYIYGPEPSLRLTSDIIEYCAKYLPSFNPISISGYHLREAGCTAAEEIAFTMCNAIAYADDVKKRGVAYDAFAPQLSFFFACHSHFFEEVAKFRAARLLWAHIGKTRYKAKKEVSMRLRFHVQTGGWTLTAQQVDNNIVRTTYQALSAVLGGCQSLHTNSKDEALGLPTPESVQTALRTQQIIAHETGIPDVIDPLGGSYFVEKATRELFDEANKILKQLLKDGGSLSAVHSGAISNRIARNAYEIQRQIDSGEKKIVGLNCFASEEEKLSVFKVSAKHEREQKKKVKALKAARNKKKVQQVLTALHCAALTKQNLFPFVLDCVQAYATVGEISDVFREIWGEFTPPHTL